MSLPSLVMVAGCCVLVIGLVAHLLTGDRIRRIVSLNVASGGVMMLLLALALRGDEGLEPDPVPQALVLTGIIIMAAITGLALALARRIEAVDDEDEPAEDAAPERSAHDDAEGSDRGEDDA